MTGVEVVGAELWRKTLTFITEHPGAWDQFNWLYPVDVHEDGPLEVGSCGTVGCLAGNALLLSGCYALRRHDDELEVRVDDRWDSVDHWVRGYARDLLGLTDEQADVAFEGERTLVELWAVAEHVTSGAVQPPTGDAARWTADELDRARAWVRAGV